MSDKLADRETLIRLLMGSKDEALKTFCFQLLLRIERLEKQMVTALAPEGDVKL